MNPSTPQRAVSLDDRDDRQALAAAIADWEPHLELEIPRRDAFLYEPDGTLYAVCLGDTIALRTERQTLEIHRGDAIVLPQGFAVEAGPVVDILALRHLGPPPDHFRERFLQVWGFEHFPAPAPAITPGRSEIIAIADRRHRVPYAIVDVRGEAPWRTSSDLELIVVLEGRVTIEQATGAVTLDPRQALAAWPGTVVRVEGDGRLGVLTVLNDLTHAARRSQGEPSRDARPEYQPRQAQDDGRM